MTDPDSQQMPLCHCGSRIRFMWGPVRICSTLFLYFLGLPLFGLLLYLILSAVNDVC